MLQTEVLKKEPGDLVQKALEDYRLRSWSDLHCGIKETSASFRHFVHLCFARQVYTGALSQWTKTGSD